MNRTLRLIVILLHLTRQPGSHPQSISHFPGPKLTKKVPMEAKIAFKASTQLLALSDQKHQTRSEVSDEVGRAKWPLHFMLSPRMSPQNFKRGMAKQQDRDDLR